MQPGRGSTVLAWRSWWRGKCSASCTSDSLGFLSAATPSFRRGGMNQLKAGGSQEVQPPGTLQGPVGLTEVCVEAALKARSNPLGPKVLESPLLGYKRIHDGFEGAYSVLQQY